MDTERRRSMRLPGYDYSQPGAYFVTICTVNRACSLGDVVKDRVVLSQTGEIAAHTWKWLSVRYPHVNIDAWTIMPNHLHGILVLGEDIPTKGRRGGSRAAPTPSRRKPLGQLIGAFKTVSTKEINRLEGTSGERLWQRGYYERVLRSEDELRRAQEYILNNPSQWALDRENPGSLVSS